MSNYKIDLDSYYVTLMTPVHYVEDIKYRCSSDQEKFVKCTVEVNDNEQTIILNAIDKKYGYQTYSNEEFVNMMKAGYIIQIDSTTTYDIVHEQEIIPLTDTVNLVNEYDRVNFT